MRYALVRLLYTPYWLMPSMHILWVDVVDRYDHWNSIKSTICSASDSFQESRSKGYSNVAIDISIHKEPYNWSWGTMYYYTYHHSNCVNNVVSNVALRIQKLTSFPEFFCPPGIELSEISHFGIPQVVHNLVSILPIFCVVTCSFCTSVENVSSLDGLNQPLSNC